ncbi:O-antigen ligase [Okibacterium sp. HSC-33S16]|uniref:O-antigen ligase family protein n=1 Tax=Okibacterium sp. HSC-33S16 TaxID=2910965 RepID=UPI0020A1EE53|nr:O-antigen ligase family protein [Okibacterium sp. HSC-33S16]MCP2032106.1 O-antigen ligase [Okibacterium sp. HSC-33S16]
MPQPTLKIPPVSKASSAVRMIEPRRWSTAATWVALIAVIVFLPDGMTRWFLPKDALLAIAAVLASLAPATGRLPRWFLGLVGAGVATLLITALLSASPIGAILGRFPRYEGLVSLSAYFAAAWIGARLLGPRSTRSATRTFTRAAAVIAVLLGFVALLETLGARPISSDLDRPGSLVGNATDQGIVGAMLLMVLVLPTIRSWRPQLLPRRGKSTATEYLTTSAGDTVLLSAGLIGAVFALVLSASRGALLATAVGIVALVVLMVLAAASRTTAWWKPVLAGAGGVALLVVVALIAPLTRSRLTGGSALSTQTVNDRVLIWQESSRMLAEKPFSGVGPSGYADAIAHAHTADWFSTVGSLTTLDSPHNVVLQAWAAGGAVFLLVALAVVAVVATVGIRAVRASVAGRLPEQRDDSDVLMVPIRDSLARTDLLLGVLAACVVWAVALLTHFTAASTSILGCLLVGVVVASVPAVKVRTWWPVLRTALVALWAGWLIAVAMAEIPLQRGIEASAQGDATGALAQFETAAALRPWDADLRSIAAQTFAAAADGGVEGAAEIALVWAEDALAAIPDNVSTVKAYIVALQATGDTDTADDVIGHVLETRPDDSDIHLRWAVNAYLQNDVDTARERAADAEALAPDDETVQTFVEFLDSVPAP